MAAYHLLTRIVEIGASEFVVTVSAVPIGMASAEVRTEVAPTAHEAQARRDYLLMSLATELRARGHKIVGAVE